MTVFPNEKQHTYHYLHLGQGSAARQHLVYQVGLPSQVTSTVSEWHAAGDQMLLSSRSAWTNCWISEWVSASLTRLPECCQST